MPGRRCSHYIHGVYEEDRDMMLINVGVMNYLIIYYPCDRDLESG